MFTLMALLALVTTGAMAQPNHDGMGSFIGIFADEVHSACDAALPLYVSTTVYFYASMDVRALTAMTACEFSVGNMPEDNPGLGIVTPAWTTTLVIGDIFGDIALAWEVPQPGPVASIGTLAFFAIDAGWIGDDHVLSVELTVDPTSLKRVIVDDLFDTYDVGGGSFTFNCTGTCTCLPSTAVEDTNWGSIKALY